MVDTVVFAGEVCLLPALPATWIDGSVSGLRARGGFDVAIRWKGGKLQSAEVRNRNAATCKVGYGERIAEFSIRAGEPLRFNAALTEL